MYKTNTTNEPAGDTLPLPSVALSSISKVLLSAPTQGTIGVNARWPYPLLDVAVAVAVPW